MAPELPKVAVLAFPGESSPPGLDVLAGLGSVQVATTPAGLEEAVADAEVLLVLDFRADVLRAAWPGARRLRWVHAASAGVDNVLFPELRDSDVVLTNARGVFDTPIAEWVLGVLLVFCKDLHTTLELQRQRTWLHRESERLAGRSALVVGAGGIGRATARLARGVGMDVTVVARTTRTDPDLGHLLGTDDLDGALPDADFVVLAAPLTEQTHGLMDARRLALMRPDARLVNVGRGELVDEEALVDALRAGRLAGAALDVFHTEPLPAGHPFWTLPNVIVSPHMSGDVVGWRTALVEQFADNLRRWTSGRPLVNVVDKTAGYASRGS